MIEVIASILATLSIGAGGYAIMLKERVTGSMAIYIGLCIGFLPWADEAKKAMKDDVLMSLVLVIALSFYLVPLWKIK